MRTRARVRGHACVADAQVTETRVEWLPVFAVANTEKARNAFSGAEKTQAVVAPDMPWFEARKQQELLGKGQDHKTPPTNT